MDAATIRISEFYDETGWQCGRPLDLRGAEGANCYCSEDAYRRIREALESIGGEGLCFIDTGDYHYITYLRMEFIREPFCLLLIDNHPDDQRGAFDADTLSCGNWVAFARERLEMLKEDDGKLPVFISVDTDALSREYARTDWSQGTMTVKELEDIVSARTLGRRIIGVDICGGLTEAKGATGEDQATNRKLMCELADFFLKKRN